MNLNFKGKLIRKEQIENVENYEVEEYPWLSFKETDLVLPDNPRKNVVHVETHLRSELARLVRPAPGFVKKLGPKIEPLIPQDLNEEFEKTQAELVLRKRKIMLDDEELFNLEMADLLNGEGENEHKNHSVEKIKEQNVENSANSSLSTSDSSSQMANDRQFRPHIPESPSIKAQQSASHTEKPKSQPDGDLQNKQAATFVASNEPTHEDHRAFEQGKEAGYAAGFAQGRQEAQAEGYAAGIEQGTEEGRAAGFSEGYEKGNKEGLAKGFEAGYRDGEIAASAAVANKSDRFFSLIGKTLSELENLRKEILLAGQDIFVEIVNLCAEKILRIKLQADDNALQEVLVHAVNLFAESHKFNIELHPSDASRMRNIFSNPRSDFATVANQVRLIENERLEPGDMKIETDKEIVSVEIALAVQQMVQDLRDKIFEPLLEEEKQSG